MKNFTLLILFCLFTSSLSAQKFKKFSSNKEVYHTELEAFLKSTGNHKKEDLESLLLQSRSLWESEGITEAETAELINISNNFLKKRVMDLAVWADFYGVASTIKNNEEDGLLLPWLSGLNKMSKTKAAKVFIGYLRSMHSTFLEMVFFDNGKITWKAGVGDFQYGFDTEPYFKFETIDVFGMYKKDSTFIEGTSGTFYPERNEFVGSGGMAYFTRAGLTQDSAYVELSQFTIHVNKSDFQADSVKLHTLIFVSEPMLGHFEERLTSQSGKNATFPRFTSYRTDIEIQDIVPGADFKGGFSMIGSKFYGGATGGAKAQLLFSYKETQLIKAEAQRFLLRKDKIESKEVEVTIMLEEDSIYHPKVTLRFLPESKRLTVIREKKGMGLTPFSDTYHGVDISFERLSWNMEEPMMYMGRLSQGDESPVVFESKQYFRGSRFEEIGGIGNENPIVLLKNMSQSYAKREFTSEEVAYNLRMSEQNAHIFLMNMSIRGFVKYDYQTREAEFQEKVFDYVANHKDQRDYDVIQFVSNLKQGDNAMLSLLDYNMEINGVRAVALSDSQQVGLFPAGQKIVVKKNLDFDFNGKITAGLFSYWGSQFEFKYDNFKIDMALVDSMRFKVESFEPNANGQHSLVDVKTVLQELSGELLIDEPDNKSSKTDYTQYPIFRSAKESHLYYDKQSIAGGAYNKEDFYVRLDAFEIDSLDNITTEGLKFGGEFVSGGIFPDLYQTLTVQQDYSLGFTAETPPEGLPMYGGEGNYKKTINLSNEGLGGDGELTYLNSHAVSETFLFFPDSTNGVASSYEITEKTEDDGSPHVVGQDVALHWEPKNDVLFTTSRSTPFAMYDDIGMQTTGTIEHGPGDLKGKGHLGFLNAETDSEDYLFNNRKFSSMDMDFRVKSENSDTWGFAMEEASGEIDFDKGLGDFNLIDTASYFQFPANQYIAYMDHAAWQIQQQAVKVEKLGLSGTSSRMISVHPKQDSLQFTANSTKYDINSTLLESFQVPNIDVADASIFPADGYVAVLEKAKMKTLENAKIRASRQNGYHNFYGASTEVQSRHSYTASADYEYMDQDGVPWPIHFDKISVDTSITTVGKTRISKDDEFFMSPHFAYYGSVKLRADRKALAFRGYTHILSSCPSVSTDWFGFESIVDPDQIIIDLPQIDPNDRTKALANGIYLASDTAVGYAAFLSKNVSPNDKQMFFANGKLIFDDELASYVITNEDKLLDPDAPGNILVFNTTDCKLVGEGIMSLGDGKSQMAMKSWGVIDYDLKTDAMDMDLVLGLDFFFGNEILKDMASRINTETALMGTDLSRRAYKAAMNDEVEPKKAASFYKELEELGYPDEFPKELESTMLFTELELSWTPEALSFLSSTKIGMGALGETSVNKMVEGYFEIQRKRSGDEIYMYLEPDRSVFYYIEYKRNVLSVYTNDESVMNLIKGIDLDKRMLQEKGKAPFTYTIATKGKMNRFLSRFEKFEE